MAPAEPRLHLDQERPWLDDTSGVMTTIGHGITSIIASPIAQAAAMAVSRQAIPSRASRRSFKSRPALARVRRSSRVAA